MSELDDTRGIIAPGEMMRRVAFARYPAPDGLEGLVDWFWSVRWSFDPEQAHHQQVLSHPAVNLSMGVAPPPGTDPPPAPYPPRIVLNGVPTRLSTRVLTGEGWTLAAKTSVGGFGAWCDDVSALTDRVLPAQPLLPGLGDDRAVEAVGSTEAERVDLLADALLRRLAQRPARRVLEAREVAVTARAAELDRGVRTADDLARVAGTTTRTLQRAFASHVGVSPTWVIRRFRLIDAAELVRGGEQVPWAEVAVHLGYSDQAHLTRDFTATLGVSPAAYARRQRPDLP